MEHDKVGEDEDEEEDLTRYTYILYWLCILNNNKILFGIHRQKFSFVIENRDMTDFYLLTLHHFFS